MPEPNQRELARQGDPKAIEAAINHQLKPRGITAEVMRDNGCLHVMMEGEQVPHHQSALVTFIRKGMDKLDVVSIYRIKIYGRQFGEDLPVWEEEIQIKPQPEEEFAVQEVVMPPEDPEISSSVPLVDDDFEVDQQIEQEFLPGIQMPVDDEDGGYDLAEDEVDLDDEDDIDEGDYNLEEDDDGDEIETTEVQSNNSGKILLFLLLLLLLALAALAGLQFSGIYTLPFLKSGGSQTEVEPTPTETENPTLETTPEASESPITGETPPPTDFWREAVNAAQAAANQAQSATTKAQWNAVASQWQKAVELMQQVPESNENYATAQQKAIEYENNRQVALKRMQQSSN